MIGGEEETPAFVLELTTSFNMKRSCKQFLNHFRKPQEQLF